MAGRRLLHEFDKAQLDEVTVQDHLAGFIGLHGASLGSNRNDPEFAFAANILFPPVVFCSLVFTFVLATVVLVALAIVSHTAGPIS
jgi:hypothetical protein